MFEASYRVVRLQPYHRNFGKRLVKTPKLYFLDVGLMAWLLSIRDATSIETHAARGARFETCVVSEFIKQRYNRGEPNDLFFWRDSSCNEIDIVYDTANGLQTIEIKSGTTFASDLPYALLKWRTMTGAAQPQAPTPMIAFGGDGGYARQGCEVLGWRELWTR